MNRWQIAIKSLFYFRRTNLAIALGVAAATAVLTGALIVGDSMRNSLRELTLERLGMIDELMLSDGFFAESLAETLSGTTEFKENYTQASSAILFPGRHRPKRNRFHTPGRASDRSWNHERILGIRATR